MIRSIFLFTALAILVLFLLPWLILWTVITNNADAMYGIAMKAIQVLLRAIGVRVHVQGRENIPPGVCIFAANHISTIDPLAFIPAIPRRIAILVKKELFRIPLLGTAMKAALFVPVDRSDRKAAAASVDLSIEQLKKGTSFAIYPEGTRSPDGRLQRLKRGTFTMAIGAGVPIVPVSIVGAQKIMRKGSWKVFGGDITVRFGEPVNGAEYTLESRDALRERIEESIEAALPEEQRPSARNA